MGTYRTLAAMVYKMVIELNWRRFHFFFNDQAAHGGSQGRSECYFSLNAIKNIFNNEPGIDWTVEMFSEQTAKREYRDRMTSFFSVLLKKASGLTNSKGTTKCIGDLTHKYLAFLFLIYFLIFTSNFIEILICAVKRPFSFLNDHFSFAKGNAKAKMRLRRGAHAFFPT